MPRYFLTQSKIDAATVEQISFYESMIEQQKREEAHFCALYQIVVTRDKGVCAIERVRAERAAPAAIKRGITRLTLMHAWRQSRPDYRPHGRSIQMSKRVAIYDVFSVQITRHSYEAGNHGARSGNSEYR